MAASDLISFSRTDKYTSTMSEQLSCIRRDKDFVDFKILIHEDFLPCHRLVLALHSPYMKAMLTSGMTEGTMHELHLDHINMDIMEIILDYMYDGEFCFHQDQMMDIIAASDYLQMTELKEMCIAEVPSILKPSNVISWWKESDMLGLGGIKLLCTKMMASDIDKVSEQPEFLSLSYTEIEQYIGDICQDDIHDGVLAATMRWISCDKINRLEHIEDVMCKAKLDKCSKEGLEKVMQTHESLLDELQVVRTLLKIAKLSLSSANMGESKQLRPTLCIAGGHDCSTDDYAVNREVWIVNKSSEIKKLCDVPYNPFRRGHSFCEIPNGFALTGGTGSSLCAVYNTLTKSWRRMSNMLNERARHASICVKSTLLVLGGLEPYAGHGRAISVSTDSVHALSLENDAWEYGPDLPLTMIFPKVTELDGNLYVLDQNSHSLLYLDVESQVWSSKTSFPLGVLIAGVSMTSAHGRLYVAGGPEKVCAFYRPATDTWCTTQPPLYTHIHGALVHFDNKLVLLGGNFYFNRNVNP